MATATKAATNGKVSTVTASKAPGKAAPKPPATQATAEKLQATTPRAPSKAEFARRAEDLKRIADGTRLQIAWNLYHGERNVGELCDMLGISQPAVSHHLSSMRLAGVVERRRQGKANYYSLSPKGLAMVGPIVAAMGG